ncbi:MAG: hypothetical protein M0T74_06180 [Desulfitobacterium hafniense]|nr:hypothetical protein [Desulfitobacterium hafniense]
MGAPRIWEKKKAENPALKAYSKAYKKRFAWIKYGKITKEVFYEWSEEAGVMRKRRHDAGGISGVAGRVRFAPLLGRFILLLQHLLHKRDKLPVVF